VGIAEKVFKVRGQGHDEIKCTLAAEAYISMAWRRGSVVLSCITTCAARTGQYARTTNNDCKTAIAFAVNALAGFNDVRVAAAAAACR